MTHEQWIRSRIMDLVAERDDLQLYDTEEAREHLQEVEQELHELRLYQSQD